MGGHAESGHGLHMLHQGNVEIADTVQLQGLGLSCNSVDSKVCDMETQREWPRLNIGNQCGNSAIKCEEVACQTQSIAVCKAVETGTQCDAPKTRSIKVGYKPEIRSSRTQTEKMAVAVKDTGVGSNTEVRHTTSQTQQPSTQPGVDVAVECLQAPQAKSRHTQTIHDTHSRGTMFRPSTVSISTSVEGEIFTKIERVCASEGEFASALITSSTPQPHYRNRIYSDISVSHDLNKDSGISSVSRVQKNVASCSESFVKGFHAYDQAVCPKSNVQSRIKRTMQNCLHEYEST
jgi:hypothetical protein